MKGEFRFVMQLGNKDIVLVFLLRRWIFVQLYEMERNLIVGVKILKLACDEKSNWRTGVTTFFFHEILEKSS